MAESIRTAEPPADHDDPWMSPVQALADLPGTGVHLDQAKSLPLKAAIDQLKGDLRATPRLVDAVTELVGSPDTYLHLRRFGASELRAAQVSQGSAGCLYFVFFTAPPGGPADVADAPAELKDRKDGSMPPCTGAGGIALAAEVSGTPAFIVSEGRDQHERISVTPWHGGWQKSCEMSLDFTAGLDVAERFCARGVDCAKASEQAKVLASRYNKDQDAFADDQALDEKLRDLKKHADDKPVGSRDFPTFGHQASYRAASFSETTVSVPIMLEGEALIAKIGHGSIGWRVYPDYLVGFYRWTGDEFEPVASAIINTRRIKPVAITIK